MFGLGPRALQWLGAGALLGVGALAAVTNLPSSLGLVVSAAVVLAVARLVYRLNTWSPGQDT